VRIYGINVWAIIGAALSIYGLGVLIYGLIVDPALWMASARISQAEMDAVGLSRMPFSPILPLVTAIGMAIVFHWAKVSGLANGIKWGAMIASLSALPALWYGWVYGVGPLSGPMIDSVHLFLGHCLAGAIIGRWN
jgi:hypothetical protein